MKRWSVAAFLYTVGSLAAIKAFQSRDTRAVEYNECRGRYDIACRAISAGNWCNIANEMKRWRKSCYLFSGYHVIMSCHVIHTITRSSISWFRFGISCFSIYEALNWASSFPCFSPSESRDHGLSVTNSSQKPQKVCLQGCRRVCLPMSTPTTSSDYPTGLLYPDTSFPPTGIGSSLFGR